MLSSVADFCNDPSDCNTFIRLFTNSRSAVTHCHPESVGGIRGLYETPVTSIMTLSPWVGELGGGGGVTKQNDGLIDSGPPLS